MNEGSYESYQKPKEPKITGIDKETENEIKEI